MQSSTNALSRRGVLTLSAAAVMTLGLPARAATTGEATALIEKVSGEILSIMNQGGADQVVLPKFEQMFDRYADVNVIAQTILGRPWRSASGAQRRDFTTALRGYLARKYGTQFREYQGADIAITGATDQGSKGVVVTTTVRAPRQAPFEVAFQVSDRSGSLKLFNLIIEGISMLTAERSEVQALLERQGGSIDRLIADLQRRG